MIQRPLRIGITCYPSLGGSGVIATELGKLLAQRGHTVHFISHHMPFRLHAYQRNIYYHEVEVSDYHVFRYMPYDLCLAAKMAQVVRHQRLDVLHVHYAMPHAICAFLVKSMVGETLRVVTTLHGTDITILGQDEMMADLIRLGIARSDAVTAVSDHLIAETQDKLRTTVPIIRIHNFVDPQVFYPRTDGKCREYLACEGHRVLVHVSNFRPVKRVHEVIEIFVRVRQVVPTKLILIGEGPELSKIVALVQQYHVQEHVHFLGKQDEVAELLCVADVMLLPSEVESFGLVALEAMACGIPTVASRVGGIPELIVDGETGFLANVGDTDAMVLAVLRLLQEEGLYRQFSEAGIRRVAQYFSSQSKCDEYEAVYAQVLQDAQQH